jgi:predicted metal-dependent hydrolase
MKSSTQHQIQLGGRVIDYRVVLSKVARRLRVRIGLNGVEVVQPSSRNGRDAPDFLSANGRWVVDQLERVERLRELRRTPARPSDEILFRGVATRVRIEPTDSQAAGNTVCLLGSEIVVSKGSGSRTPASRSLENWLRREARRAIESHLGSISGRLGQGPTRTYVMSQRTKWGNCSSRRNLSFNWRLVLAPEYVLRYLVTHEAVHLAVPDHSTKFWLTVQSLCRETERARRWLVAHAQELAVDLRSNCGELQTRLGDQPNC